MTHAVRTKRPRRDGRGTADRVSVDAQLDSTVPCATLAAPNAAADYHRRGWRIVPVPAGQKKPAMAGWQDFEPNHADVQRRFGRGENVGIVLGARSGDLVDIDLDSPKAVALADLYLPATDAAFGRPAKPRSHRLFIASGSVFESFADPSGNMTILEFRATGRDGGAHMTLFPPSIANGEAREWSGGVIAPRPIDAGALRTSAAVARHRMSRRPARLPATPPNGQTWTCRDCSGSGITTLAG
jgi:hypothetical protein